MLCTTCWGEMELKKRSPLKPKDLEKAYIFTHIHWCNTCKKVGNEEIYKIIGKENIEAYARQQHNKIYKDNQIDSETLQLPF